MPSKFASELLEKIDQGDGMLTALEASEYEDLLDAELQEVREVLDGLITFVFDEGDGQRPRLHWCDPEDNVTIECTPACQRARALYQRLRVDGAPAEGKDG